MFAKVFGQIFDSSIAEDYNCRRMFIDLLVLADQTGAVDMTVEAIARRTNVPIKEVVKYLDELQRPDPSSRSKKSDGKRIVPLDSHRDWGWQIVNYKHYRDLRDAETLRLYFRDAQRRSRKNRKRKLQEIKTPKHLSKTGVDSVERSLTPASASEYLKEGVRGRFEEWMKFRRGLGKKPKDWETLFQKQAEWLAQFSETDQIAILDQSMRNGWQGLFEPKVERGRPQKTKEDIEYEQFQAERRRQKQNEQNQNKQGCPH